MTKSLALLLFLLAACAAPDPRTDASGPTHQGQRELGMLASFLTGTWDTKAGANAPVRLRMVEFWRGKPGEHWIYAEYVSPGDETRPIRQRIYRFTEAGGKITGIVYRVPGEPGRFAGEWRKAAPFDGVTPRQLEEFANCRMIWDRRLEAMFAGGTEGNRCRGDRPGVAYERSEFSLSSSSLRNLEQGYDGAGRHVAGEAAPHEFDRSSREAR